MRVLITAASRHGATSEVASVVGAILGDRGFEVATVAPEAVESLADYDAVILGSGVYAGHWLATAKTFVTRFEEPLRARPVFLFSCGPLGDPPKPEAEPEDAIEIACITQAVSHRLFPGRLQRSALPFAEKVVVAAVRAPDGDFRPWDDISDWAREVGRQLDMALLSKLLGPEVPAAQQPAPAMVGG
jgi:menaquinone-dependent protoporphyrinogen oxidase